MRLMAMAGVPSSPGYPAIATCKETITPPIRLRTKSRPWPQGLRHTHSLSSTSPNHLSAGSHLSSPSTSIHDIHLRPTALPEQRKANCSPFFTGTPHLLQPCPSGPPVPTRAQASPSTSFCRCNSLRILSPLYSPSPTIPVKLPLQPAGILRIFSNTPFCNHPLPLLACAATGPFICLLLPLNSRVSLDPAHLHRAHLPPLNPVADPGHRVSQTTGGSPTCPPRPYNVVLIFNLI